MGGEFTAAAIGLFRIDGARPGTQKCLNMCGVFSDERGLAAGGAWQK